MAKVKLNPLLESIRGAIGDVVFKQYGERIILSRRPDFKNRVFSEAQKACQERFRQAALSAKRLMADPRARTVYEEEARVKGKPILSLMIADFLRSPIFFHDQCGRAGGSATVRRPECLLVRANQAGREKPVETESSCHERRTPCLYSIRPKQTVGAYQRTPPPSGLSPENTMRGLLQEDHLLDDGFAIGGQTRPVRSGRDSPGIPYGGV